MKRLKAHLLTLSLFSIVFTTSAQVHNEGEDHPEVDSATAVGLPWYDNN